MIYISLGSNLGDRLQNLRKAVKFIEERFLQNTLHSIILETEALSFEKDTPSYLNMIVAGTTDLLPHEVLIKLKEIEREMGRPKIYEKWSSRVIDLDILLYKDLEIRSENLTIPHPEIKNRPFLRHLLSLMGLKDFISKDNILSFKKSFILNPEIVGIVNITNDSFSDGGKFLDPERALVQSLSLISDGASVIDIGAQSTRPGAVMKNGQDEISALQPVLDGLKGQAINISIDTFKDEVVEWLIKNYKISWINNVMGKFEDQTLNLIKESECKICMMHSITVPPEKNSILPQDCDPIEVILTWGEKIIKKLKKVGFSDENIIIDPGIGFGKTHYQNLEILQRAYELKILGVPIMIGHSRKGYVNSLTNYPADLRDIETIAISELIGGQVDYIRVHNVRDHMKFFVTRKVIEGVKK